MTAPAELSRRGFLRTGLTLGCSAAASPFLTSATFAALPGDNRLVVIILRGAMDALDVVQPYGDPAIAGLRPTLKSGEAAGASDLDGFYALNPALAPLMPMWKAGELGFIHAVSTPYRAKRSHFDGQDMLENGSDSPEGQMTPGRDGWLNRTLKLLPGADVRTAFSVGQENMLLLDGKAPYSSWSPESQLEMSQQGRDLLALVYRNDPSFRAAADEAFDLSMRESNAMDGANRVGAVPLARYAAEQLNADTRIAAFSLGGWDTHRNQQPTLRRALESLVEALAALKDGLGRNWQRTAVVAVTEFGRTARENGTKGTDHGTGGAMVLAGGAVKGGKVHGVWPGLGESDLLAQRDLKPTDDVRRHLGWLVAGMLGVSIADLGGSVFPGTEFGKNPGILL